jgi:hypothetical protein
MAGGCSDDDPVDVDVKEVETLVLLRNSNAYVNVHTAATVAERCGGRWS